MNFPLRFSGQAILAVTLSCGVSFANVAHANLRAPLLVRAPPSSTPLKSEGRFTVLGEVLQFDCSEHECLVEAHYRIRSADAVSARMTFVMPSNALAEKATAHLGGQALAFRATPLTDAQRAGLRRTEAEAGFGEWVGRDTSASEKFELQLAQGEFDVPFESGENDVSIRYVQPLGMQEHDHGYFKKGRFLKTFRYELWPLNEWVLDGHFTIELRVTAPRLPPGYFQRTLGTVASISCGPPERGLPESIGVAQRGDRMAYEVTLGPKFPSHLFCSIGDEDLLPRGQGSR